MIESQLGATAFRLVPYAEYDAITNMAIDETLLDLYLEERLPPTLRFYGWSPPAVSFGYGQKVSAQTIERINEAGYDVVRRPTGGRAVLHEGELTYCFIAGEPILDSSIARAYRQICDALIAGLVALGVAASMGKSADGSYKSYEDCFQATTQADLQYQGKKIVGSAQLRRHNSVLQHGSIMVNQSQDRMAQLLGVTEKSPDDGQQRHFNLNEILSTQVDRTTLEAAIVNGFTDAFNCRFAINDLSDQEMALVEAAKTDQNRYRIKSL